MDLKMPIHVCCLFATAVVVGAEPSATLGARRAKILIQVGNHLGSGLAPALRARGGVIGRNGGLRRE